MAAAILVDTTRCVGCGACVTACKEVNGLPPGNDNELCAVTLTVVETRAGVYVRRFCMHCQDPACVSVCPVGAFQRTPGGAVVYDGERCMGCRYCMLACPFNIPRYEWNSTLPKVTKCHMCASRQARGLEPACTEACPVQAAIFGTREELLREAEKRVRENPAGYLKYLYGKEEVGGTSVLYLAAVPFEALGFPSNLPRDPLPLCTYRILTRIPHLLLLGGAALGGIWWITNRRERVARAEADVSSRGDG